ncbi:hypothetical protein [Burkholderia anthina]|uniref:hypothetical protein n=1 Tax=Burkholderia anthina TaxID=179879 RepID=UPI0012DA06C9|nr:hypothetical protein [Burkholderia anthina]
MHARPAAHARWAEPRNAGAAGCAPDGSCLNFFKVRGCLSQVRDNRTIRRRTLVRRGECAGRRRDNRLLHECPLPLEWISPRSGQRIIASFAEKRQIAAARAVRAAMLDAWRPLGDDEGRSIQADEGRFAARGMAAGNYPTVPRE